MKFGVISGTTTKPWPGRWKPGGDILNDFLNREHNADGSLKIRSDGTLSAIPQSSVTDLTTDLAAKAANSAVVHNATDETIAGVKTFSASPIVPTPTTSTQAATKAYVDGHASTISIAKGGTAMGTEPTLNFIEGSNVTITTADNSANSRVDITIASSAAGGGGGDASTNTATSVDSEIALFAGTGGKTLKRATGSGIATLTAGVIGTLTAPTGAIVGVSDTQTLTNKTISGASNGLSNIPESAVTNLTSDLAAKAPAARSIATGTGLTGGGDLSADRTISVSFGTTSTTVAAGNHTHVATDLTSGTVATARLGSGTADATTYLAGDQTYKSLRTEPLNTVTTAGASQTLPDPATTPNSILTLTSATCSLAFPTAASGKSLTVALKQDATAGRLVSWPASVKWPAGVAPHLVNRWLANRPIFVHMPGRHELVGNVGRAKTSHEPSGSGDHGAPRQGAFL